MFKIPSNEDKASNTTKFPTPQSIRWLNFNFQIQKHSLPEVLHGISTLQIINSMLTTPPAKLLDTWMEQNTGLSETNIHDSLLQNGTIRPLFRFPTQSKHDLSFQASGKKYESTSLPHLHRLAKYDSKIYYPRQKWKTILSSTPTASWMRNYQALKLRQ